MVQYDRLDWIELAYQTHLTHSAPNTTNIDYLHARREAMSHA